MPPLFREILAWLRLIISGFRYRPTVLMYHSIGKNAVHFTVTPDAFARQMRWLKDNAWSVLTLDACVKRALAGETGKFCALTFDDGYKDFIEQAMPVLKAHGFPATAFLITGKMGVAYTISEGVSLPLMTWADADDLMRTPGIGIGSHTMTHPKLTKLSSEDVRKELAASREALARELGCEDGLWLCYPHGRNSEEVRRIAREEGYVGAVTIEAGHPMAGTDIFAMPRVYVHSEMGLKEFEALFV